MIVTSQQLLQKREEKTFVNKSKRKKENTEKKKKNKEKKTNKERKKTKRNKKEKKTQNNPIDTRLSPHIKKYINQSMKHNQITIFLLRLLHPHTF